MFWTLFLAFVVIFSTGGYQSGGFSTTSFGNGNWYYQPSRMYTGFISSPQYPSSSLINGFISAQYPANQLGGQVLVYPLKQTIANAVTPIGAVDLNHGVQIEASTPQHCQHEHGMIQAVLKKTIANLQNMASANITSQQLQHVFGLEPETSRTERQAPFQTEVCEVRRNSRRFFSCLSTVGFALDSCIRDQFLGTLRVAECSRNRINRRRRCAPCVCTLLSLVGLDEEFGCRGFPFLEN